MSSARDFRWAPTQGVFGHALCTTIEDGRQVLLCPAKWLEQGRGSWALMIERACLGRYQGTLDEAREQAEKALGERFPNG